MAVMRQTEQKKKWDSHCISPGVKEALKQFGVSNFCKKSLHSNLQKCFFIQTITACLSAIWIERES